MPETGSVSVAEILWFAGWVGLAALLVRLWLLRLLRRYRYFTTYIAAELAQGVALWVASPLTDAYALTYFTFVPVLGVASTLAVLEIFDMVLRNHPGIGSLGRWLVLGGLALSLAIAVASLFPDLGRGPDSFPILLYFSIFERALYSALLLLILLITAFLTWFPVPLSRNTVIHTAVFGVFFGSHAVLLLVRNVFGAETIRALSMVYQGVFLVCTLVWIFLLTRDGERAQVVFGHRWDPVQGRRLVEQLDSLNATILRSGRK